MARGYIAGFGGVSMPTWTEDLHDRALLSAKDVGGMFGVHHNAVPTCVERGTIPAPDAVVIVHNNRANRWSAGVLRRFIADGSRRVDSPARAKVRHKRAAFSECDIAAAIQEHVAA